MIAEVGKDVCSELLKRIAEIEGIAEWHDERVEADIDSRSLTTYPAGYYIGGHFLWNPLESWFDCGPLIEKYKLIISPMENGVFEPWFVSYNRLPMSFYETITDPDLKTAIVKAIVASKGVGGE